MTEIKIAGHAERNSSLSKILRDHRGEYDLVLITNVNHPFPEWVRGAVKDVLHLAFDDVTFSHGTHSAPKEEHVRQALEWAKDRERIIVACHAGVSRSAALAYLVAAQAWNPTAALGVLEHSRHYPNHLLVRHGAAILGDSEVWDRFHEWCAIIDGSPAEFSREVDGLDLRDPPEHMVL